MPPLPPHTHTHQNGSEDKAARGTHNVTEQHALSLVTACCRSGSLGDDLAQICCTTYQAGLSSPTMLCKYTDRTEFGGPCDTQIACTTLKQPTLGHRVSILHKHSPLPANVTVIHQFHVYWRPTTGLPTGPMSGMRQFTSALFIVRNIGTSQRATREGIRQELEGTFVIEY